MKRDGWVKIRRPEPGKFDLHISAPWQGTVVARLPSRATVPLLAHYAADGGVIENVVKRGRFVVVRLQSLSILTFLKCASQLPDTKKLVACMLRNGMSTIKGGVVKTILDVLGKKLGKSLAGCESNLPEEISLALLDGFLETCKTDPGTYDWSKHQPTAPTPTAPPSNPPSNPPPSYVEPNFIVMNTSETPPDGVYFRNSTNWSDTNRTTGLGVYAGEVVHVYCWAWGEAVGSYSNNVWYYVFNASRPTLSTGVWNGGWINTHYVNDGMTADHSYPGIRQC